MRISHFWLLVCYQLPITNLLKSNLKPVLEQLGREVTDEGPDHPDSVPRIAKN